VASGVGCSTTAQVAAVLDAYDFSGLGTIVDVSGG
jgi:hypothetical protein